MLSRFKIIRGIMGWTTTMLSMTLSKIVKPSMVIGEVITRVMTIAWLGNNGASKVSEWLEGLGITVLLNREVLKIVVC
jgi:hypothetical protein